MIRLAGWFVVVIVLFGLGTAAWRIIDAVIASRQPPNYKVALLLEDFAANGSAAVKTSYALLLKTGPNRYIRQDVKGAFEWTTRAANAGDPLAMALLGEMHLKGEAPDSSLSEALDWFRQSALKGNSWGIYYMGHVSWFGLGRPSNRPEAINYFEKAAALNHPDAARILAAAYNAGDEVPTDPSRAATFLKIAAEHSTNGNYTLELADWYFSGTNVPKSDLEGVKWLKLAANSGSPVAARRLGQAMTRGLLGQPKDLKGAEYWLAKAARYGDGPAQVEMAKIFLARNQPAPAFAWGARAWNQGQNTEFFREAAQLAEVAYSQLSPREIAALIAETHVRAYGEDNH
ncbi:MAG: sel1 repeat family protein [Rhodospirillaceae bacterium]|nr:sel1 repeat family protein [Rhodospirillales bacterium]